MLKLLILSFFIFSVQVQQISVPKGSTDYLESSASFYGIKPGDNVLKHEKKIEFSEDFKDGTYFYNYVSKPLPINMAKIEHFAVISFRNRIYSMNGHFPSASGPKLLAYFLKEYGPYHTSSEPTKNLYNWRSKSVSLDLNYQKSTTGIGSFTFMHIPLRDELYKTPKFREAMEKIGRLID
ncbi:hypothetical protein [Pedobacter sp. GR22-6]|uniref:hypothetical protein n=1 Tax=Pedobacter sp. GR22-6 TaxID=3127957 RepID=UPI00307E9502